MGLAVILGVMAPACGSRSVPAGGPTTVAGPPRTLDVPSQYPTIQEAVNSAAPGDLILVSPGTYRESVTISVPDLDLRGLDRSTVVLDGGDSLVNGVTATGNGDVVEDLTVAHYAVNGILFTKAAYAGSDASAGPADTPVLDGYRASYVTAYDDGLYGIYAFGARNGQIDHVYASGHPDSGIYIGQCNPCDAVVTDAVGEHNRVGFEAANGSGGLDVIDSTWDANRAGVAVESSTEERLAPQQGALVAGNVVEDNDDPETPDQNQATDVYGYGIVIGGGSGDLVRANRVQGNSTVGILVTDAAGYRPSHDTVTGDVATGNGTDLAFTATSAATVAAAGTCFGTDTYTTSLPRAIVSLLPCSGGGASQIAVGALPAGTPPAGVDYTTLPAPAAQAPMPDAATAPPRAATGLGGGPPPASVTLPAGR